MKEFNKYIIQNNSQNIIFDLHSFVYNDFEYVKIPTEVISGFSPTQLILVEAQAYIIYDQSKTDMDRRAARTVQQIEYEMDLCRSLVNKYSLELNVPLRIFQNKGYDTLVNLIK